MVEEARPQAILPFEGNGAVNLRELLAEDFDRLHLYSLRTDPQAEAILLMANMPDEITLILAGHAVAKDFGVKARFFEACLLESTQTIAYVVPHPGIGNAWYNNEFNQFKARNFFEALFLVQDGVSRPDGHLGYVEFNARALVQAVEAGRIF